MRQRSRRRGPPLREPLLAIGLLALVFSGTPMARAAQLAPGDLLAVVAEHLIVRLDPAGGPAETLFSVTGTELKTLYAIAVERSGRVLVLAFGAGRQLVRVDPTDGSYETVTALPDVPFPFSMGIDRSGGTLFYVDFSGAVVRVDLGTGVVGLVATLPGGFGGRALALAPDGKLYVSDDALDTLFRIDPESGATEIVAEGVEFGGFYRAHGIDVDREGRIVGTRYDPPAILRVDPVTGQQQEVASGGLLDFPVEIEIDREGRVFAANLWAGAVARIDLATGEQAWIDTTSIVTGLAIVPHPECANGRDDDGDGLADDPADPGCFDPNGVREDPACDDGIDNDGDGGIDWDGGGMAAADSQCSVAHRNQETPSACGLGAELTGILVGLRAGTRRGRSLACVGVVRGQSEGATREAQRAGRFA